MRTPFALPYTTCDDLSALGKLRTGRYVPLHPQLRELLEWVARRPTSLRVPWLFMDHGRRLGPESVRQLAHEHQIDRRADGQLEPVTALGSDKRHPAPETDKPTANLPDHVTQRPRQAAGATAPQAASATASRETSRPGSTAKRARSTRARGPSTRPSNDTPSSANQSAPSSDTPTAPVPAATDTTMRSDRTWNRRPGSRRTLGRDSVLGWRSYIRRRCEIYCSRGEASGRHR